MKKFDAVGFDLDRTLVHTRPEYMLIHVNATLSRMGLGHVSGDAARRFWLGPDRDSVIKLELGAEPEKFWKIFEKIDSELAEKRKASTFPFGDLDAIDRIREMGYRVGLVTGNSPYNTEWSLEIIGKEKFESVVCCGFNGVGYKPDPDGLVRMAADIGCEPSRILFVGDGEEDMAMAEAAGAYGIRIDREGKNGEIRNLYELLKML